MWKNEAEKFGFLNWDHEVNPTCLEDTVENIISRIRKDFSRSKVEVISPCKDIIKVVWYPGIGKPMNLIEIDATTALEYNQCVVSYSTKADYYMPDYFHAAASHALNAAVRLH